ncbi:MAG: autotransporter outer membrane beta-barrel domain-containing protein [Selenomonadaceae bacterium]|nr:autotransporter outer membrane beta-barrel domain-containing protein [Selenomonadaceae bacterium]MDY2685447.1 autotransporter outer membrane beta-barrel domain-containing protein [Selenomonadaceae bacterium]
MKGKGSRQKRLAHTIALGMVAGTAGVLPFAGSAEATTLTEYRSMLATSGDTYIADDAAQQLQHVKLASDSKIKEVRAVNQGGAAIDVQDGAKDNNGAAILATDLREQPDGSYKHTDEGGYVDLAFGVNWAKAESYADVPESDAEADLTNTKFFADAGDIVLDNGTIRAKASNIYGGTVVGKTENSSTGHLNIGLDPEDDTAAFQTHPTLKLEGNTKFNVDGWKNLAGETVKGKNFIHINRNGTLEAESAQLFNQGLGEKGEVTDPKGLRSDASDAVWFNDGTVLLDDPLYNTAYADAAQAAISADDSGSTILEVKNRTGKTSTAASTSKMADAKPVTTQNGATIILEDDTPTTQLVQNLNSSSNVKEIRAVHNTWAIVNLADGMADNGTLLQTTNLHQKADGTFESEDDDGGEIELGFGIKRDMNTGELIAVPESTAVADMRNTTFKAAEGGFHQLSGTVITKASQIFGTYDIGAGFESDDEGYKNVKAKATLKLVGNTPFNVNGWKTLDGSESTKIKIGLTKKGILEAESAQLFQKGLSGTGDVQDPGGLRKDADTAIDFAGVDSDGNRSTENGAVVLDDDYYNADYLDKAQAYIQAADGGNKTTVEMKSGATKVEARRALSSVPDNAAFTAVDAGTSDVVLANASQAANYKTVDATLNKFNATHLNLDANSDGKTASSLVADGVAVHLGSSTDGQELLTVNDKVPGQSVNVTVKNGGSLTLGTGAAQNNLEAKVTLGTQGTTDSAALTVRSGSKSVRSITANEGTSVQVTSGTLLTTDKLQADGATVTVDGTLKAEKISSADSTITVGNEKSAGTLTISDADSTLTGSKVFLDPVWKDGEAADLSDASKFAATLNSDGLVDYTLAVGQNSIASLGTDETDTAEKAFAKTGETWGKNATTAALYLAQPIKLDSTSGGIVVDGSLTSSPSVDAGSATFGANSLLMIDASKISNTGKTAAITADGGKLTVDQTAKLYLANVTSAGTKYKITTGFSDVSDAKGWADVQSEDFSKNILLDKLLKVDSASTDGANGIVLNITRQSAKNALPDVVLPNSLDGITDFDTASKNAGIRYMASATNGLLSNEEAANRVNYAAQPAEMAGATAMGLRDAQNLADTAQAHFSFLGDAENTHPDDVWVKYGHVNTHLDDMHLAGGDVDYKNHVNSITVGFDFKSQKKENDAAFRNGLAFSYSKGSTDGFLESDKYHVGGASYYGAYRKGQQNILADIGYYSASHKIDGLFHVGPDQHIFTMGAGYEQKVQSGRTTVIPHIGLRYTFVDTPDYDGTYDGGKAFHYDPQSKGLVSLPVGVGFISDTQHRGWTYRTYGDLSFVGVLGGRSNDMDVNIFEQKEKDRVSYDVAGKNSFLGRLGFTASNQKMSWGFGYSYRGSSNEHSNNWTAQLKWAF